MYLYVKAIHIIFMVTWFAGLFYMPRLFIYQAEAEAKEEPAKSAVQDQLGIMAKRLWYGITWPSAVLTLIFGTWMGLLYGSVPQWLLIKLFFVAGLYAYQFSLQYIFDKHKNKIYPFSAQKLRLWNEIATIFLVAIVMLVSVKQSLSFVWALAVLVLFILLLFSAIRIYKIIREKKN